MSSEEKTEQKAYEYIPLYVNVRGMKVLVIGGGSVGSRRALMFKKAGASVTVVANNFSETLQGVADIRLKKLGLPEGMNILKELIRESDIIVIALNDEKLADEIASVALDMKKFVNNAIDHSNGNVIVPFSSDIEGLNIAITSFGATGLAARLALDKIVKILREDQEIKAVYKSMSRLKTIIRTVVKDPNIRMRIYHAIYEDEIFRSYVRKGDWSSAYLRGLKIIESFGITLDPSYYIISQNL